MQDERRKPKEPVEPLVLDNLRPGAEVVSANGKDVGKLHAVVVDPRDDDITHIAVNAGPFFPAIGFGAPRLVSVPIEEMADAREAKVLLKITKRKFEELPDYAEWSFAPPKTEWSPPDGLSPDLAVANVRLIQIAQTLGGGLASPWEIRHRRKFEREIPHGSHVWRVEPETHIGEVDRILSDEVTEHVRALVVKRGHFFGHDVVLPIEYVTDIDDIIVHVQLTDEELDALEEFQAPREP
jgi:sporulation protein YlmC with PRC-barrel domain